MPGPLCLLALAKYGSTTKTNEATIIKTARMISKRFMRLCNALTSSLGGAGPLASESKQDAPSRVHSRPLVSGSAIVWWWQVH